MTAIVSPEKPSREHAAVEGVWWNGLPHTSGKGTPKGQILDGAAAVVLYVSEEGDPPLARKTFAWHKTTLSELT